LLPGTAICTAKRLDLFGLSNFRPGEYGSRQYALRIEQDLVRPNMNVIELALTAKHKFTFYTIGESEEHDVKAVITEDFQENRLT